MPRTSNLFSTKARPNRVGGYSLTIRWLRTGRWIAVDTSHRPVGMWFACLGPVRFIVTTPFTVGTAQIMYPRRTLYLQPV